MCYACLCVVVIWWSINIRGKRNHKFFSVPHIFTRMTSRWLILNSLCRATATTESVRFMYLVQCRCPQKEIAYTYFKKKEVVITSLVWKIMFLTKSGLCQIDQQSYGCCLVRQEEEKLWRGKQFCSLKYKNYVRRCSDYIKAHFNSKRRISQTWHYFFLVGEGRGGVAEQ